MSSDNGEAEKPEPSKKPEPVPVNILAHASIVQLHEQHKAAKAKIDLAITILKQQLGVPTEWEYDLSLKAFAPPIKSTPSRSKPSRISGGR